MFPVEIWFNVKNARNDNIKRPEIWGRDYAAGIEWLKGCMKRNADLSLRTPENTSLKCDVYENTITLQFLVFFLKSPTKGNYNIPYT